MREKGLDVRLTVWGSDRWCCRPGCHWRAKSKTRWRCGGRWLGSGGGCCRTFGGVKGGYGYDTNSEKTLGSGQTNKKRNANVGSSGSAV